MEVKKARPMLSLLVLLPMLSLLLLLAGASAGASDDGPGDAVIAAIRAAGGYVDHRQEIVELAPGYRGVVARRAIDAGAVLARIPWSGLLAAEGTCPLALALAEKLRAKDAADPLAAYLASLESYDPALPDAWSSLANVAKLPPRDWRRHPAWFDAKCRPAGAAVPLADPAAVARAVAQAHAHAAARADGADDRALHLVVGRAGAGQGVHFMAPLYDLYNHRNGRHHNTRVHVDAGVEVKVVAHREIAAGEEPCGKSNLQPDFNVLREIDESKRPVQKSAESASIWPSERISKFGPDVTG